MRLWPKRKPKTVPLRRGILIVGVEGAGLLNRGFTADAQVEVAEWETLGAKSRITVENVSGVTRDMHRRVSELVPRWVPTLIVDWLE